MVSEYHLLADPTSYRQQRWQDARKQCEEELGDEDFQYLMRFETHAQLLGEVDNLIVHARQSSIPRLLRQLKPHIYHIETFFLGALLALDFSSTESVCIWGLVTLMLQVHYYVEHHDLLG